MSELAVRNTTEVVRTVDVIAAEIRSLTAGMLSNVIEIGRRMVEAKDMLPHGEFGPWLKANTGYSTSTANNYMRIFEEYGSPQKSLFGAEVNNQTFGNLTYSKALALLEVPTGERESFVKENDVESMSTRELKQALKERDEALKQAEAAKAEAKTAEQARAKMEVDAKQAHALLAASDEEKKHLQALVREMQDRPVEVAVQEPDPAAIDAAVKEALAQAEDKHRADMAKLQTELDKEVAESNKLEKKIEKLKAEAKTAVQRADDTIRQTLEQEVRELEKKLAMAGPETTAFRIRFSAWQKAYSEMQQALSALPDAEQREKMKKAVKAQIDEWVKR